MKRGESGLTELMHTRNGNNKPDRTKPLLLLLGGGLGWMVQANALAAVTIEPTSRQVISI